METTTSIFEQANYWFPYSEDKLFLRNVVKVFEFAAHPSVQIQFYIAIVGLVVTFLHLIILTRKSIMTTSVISIMIGVGICDFIAMIATIIYTWIIYNEDDENPCIPPTPLNQLYIYWVFINVRELVRRSSTWLGVVLALVRYINLKFWTKTKFQHYALPLYGFVASLRCFLGSVPFSIIYYFRYNIIFHGEWNPSGSCIGFSKDNSSKIYSFVQVPSELFTDWNGAFGKVYMFVNGVVSKILPCILLPLLTFLLINEIKKADKVRITGSFMKRKKGEKTTNLVIFMTFTFFIVEFPLGLVVVLQVAFTELGYLYIATSVGHICNMIFTMNAITHCLICFLMSVQYRNTVRSILGVRKEQNQFITAVSTAQLVKIWEHK